MRFLISFAAAFSALPMLAAGAAGGLAGLDWSIANTPETGLTDIVFPFTIESALPEEGYYFAQSFKFMNPPPGSTGLSHVGLKPYHDIANSTYVLAVFSTSINGTESSDVLCYHPPHDGYCFTAVEINHTDPYNIHVYPGDGEQHWGCSVTNSRTGDRWHIGSLEMPEGTGGIEGSESGFVEYKPWSLEPSEDCESLTYTSVVFGAPKTKTVGAGNGTIGKGYEKGVCKGEVDFETETTEEGTRIALGFE
ncbi:hypothetical protein FQN54_004703 [Arachnomyces sp. PD_36]|nr:hypothetical protein FQN54_004703 [Arachnomyces sp. PD_36]